MIIIQIHETREVLLPPPIFERNFLLCSVLLVPDFFEYNQTEFNGIQDQEFKIFESSSKDDGDDIIFYLLFYKPD